MFSPRKEWAILNEPTDLLDADAVAKKFCKSKRTVYAWAEAGILPSIKLSRRTIRFDAKEIERFIEAHRRGGERAQ